MQTQYDLIILGGGCAGLSLASRLAAFGSKSPQTLLLESRAYYVNDRTRCFWNTFDHPLSPLVSHRWRKISLRAIDQLVMVDCGSTPYQMIPADRFYSHSQEALAKSRSVTLRFGSPVLTDPRKTDGRWFVETPAGVCSAAMIVDTRPISRLPDGPLLWQSFYGQEVECDEAIFNPGCVDLMAFGETSSTSIPFTYLLPLSEKRALIEMTVFAPHPVPFSELAHHLEYAVKRHTGGAAVKLQRSEHGVLPMGNAAPRRGDDASYVRAGLTSGGARASSGYAFQRIQRWADTCAGLLRASQWPVGHSADPLILRVLDHLFVSVLRANPSSGPAMFLSLFRRVEAERIIRFMSDGGSLVDYAMIAAALPARPFVGQLLREFSGLLNPFGKTHPVNPPLTAKESQIP